MKPKRRIKAMYNKLSKLPVTAEIKAAQDLLAWVLDENEDLVFEDIIPEAIEPKSRLSAENYAYGVEQMVWVMQNPLVESQVFITESKPSFTPVVWWEKKPLNDIGEEITFGEDYLSLLDGFVSQGDTVSWLLIEDIFQLYPGLFRTRKQVEKYLLHFFKIDYSDRVEVNTEEREKIVEETGFKTTALRSEIERRYNAEWVATYKESGDRIWVMRKIE